MNLTDRQDMQLHLRIVGWLHFVNSAIVLVVGIFVFTLLPGIGLATGDSIAVGVLSVLGISVGVLLLCLALPGLLAGYGLLTGRSWSRILAIVVSLLGLFNIPIGTLIGGYTLWVLLQSDADYYFVKPKPA